MRQTPLAAALALLLPLAAYAQPITTAFTYQGAITNNGQAAQGSYDLRFRLYDTLAGTTQIGSTLCIDNVTVIDGRFTASLDFGSQFVGLQRFLEIEVRPDIGLNCSNLTGFTILGPRQPLTATPFASYATLAGSATQLNGQAASFYTNAANLTTGTIPDLRLSSNVAQLSQSGAFTGTPAFNGGVSGVSAPFTVDSTTRVNNLNADLLDGLDSSAFSLSSHTHDATAITTGLLADARLTSNIPRLNVSSTYSAGQTILTAVQTPLSLASSSVGGTWFNLANTSASGRAWNFINTSSGNSEGAGKLLIRDQNAGAVRLTFDTAGNVGIGTTSPQTPLDVQVASGQSLQFRLDQFVPGINVNNPGGNAGIMRLRNAMEIWPSDDATRSGRVDVRDTGGNATVVLDGATGNISAKNLTAIKSAQTFSDSRGTPRGQLQGGSNTALDTLSFTAPANGTLLLMADVTVEVDATAVFNGQAAIELKLDENTVGSSGLRTNTRFGCNSGDFDGTNLTLSWTVPVTAGSVRTFQTGLYVYRVFGSGSPSAHFWSSSLRGIFIPNSLP